MTSISESRQRGDGLSVVHAGFAPGLQLGMHSHALATVSVNLRGGYQAKMGNSSADGLQGTAIVTPAGEPHDNRFGPEPTWILVVEIAPDASWMRPVFANFLSRPAILRDVRASALAERAAREIEDPDAVSPLACEGIAMELVATMARLDEPGERRPPRWLLQVRDLLHEDFDQPLRLEDLARAGGVERTRLLRAFRAHLHTSPGAYLRRVRVERAAVLLRTTQDPIAEIAAATGFADQSHLTRLFKRVMGLTPAAWRAQRA